MNITPPKTRYQNDVTKIIHFQAPPLVKSWLRSWSECDIWKTFKSRTGIGVEFIEV